ncbi:MAG: hypothetical protein KF689_13480 [Gemmatimonadaceae bacterium]|nr:hypothetical protein [Gemmatimonadaceae bacterium]MCW5827003.1 hypothetical protein [Gemmatimonadaceae bacterium]
MRKPIQTRPFDVVVAARLLSPAGTLAEIADELAASASQVHVALGRLEIAGLLRPEQRRTNARAFVDFALGGLRYSFPVLRGPLANGVPTAYSAGPLSELVDAPDVVVWPAANTHGAVRGFSLTPLHPRAAQLRDHAPETYRVLTVLDALRLGEVRLRAHARSALEAITGERQLGGTS